MFKESSQAHVDTSTGFEGLPRAAGDHVHVQAPDSHPGIHWWQTLVLCREWGRVTSWLAGPTALSSLVEAEMWETSSNWRSRFSLLSPGTPWGIDGGGVVVMDMDHSTLLTLQDPLFPGVKFREAKRIRMPRTWGRMLRRSVSLTQNLLHPRDIDRRAPIISSRSVVRCPEGWWMKAAADHLSPDEALFSFLSEMRKQRFAPPSWYSVQKHLDTIKEGMQMVVAESRQLQLNRLKSEWLHPPTLN